MANIHFFLQGKGGVGKSFCATMLTQYIIASGRPNPICIDTDPVNATFAAYKAFNVMRVEIMNGDKIDPLQFDLIMEKIFSAEENDTVIIDNGASSFLSFSSYLLSADVPNLLDSLGHSVFINTIITGGDAMGDTMHGFGALASQFPSTAKILVWLNPYFGVIGQGNRRFQDSPIYQSYKNKVLALIDLPDLARETFGMNLSRMLKERLTFPEAILGQDSGYSIMDRQRLKIAQQKIFATIPPEI